MHKSYLPLLVALFLALPLTAQAQQLTTAPSTDRVYTDYENDRGGTEVAITQNADTSFLEGGGVSCAGPGGGAPSEYTVDNSYWRLFDLTEFGITDDVTVTDVDMAISISLTEPLTEFEAATALNFYTVEGEFILENSTLLGSNEFIVTEENAGLAIVNIPVDGVTIPGGSMFAFEWATPSGDAKDTGLEAGFQLRFGQNAEGQTGSTYLSSPVGCGIAEPTPAEDLGAFGDLHWVVVINGVTGGDTAGEDGAVAQRVSLGQSFPNPAASRTTVPFSLETAQNVRVAVYDALGRQVALAADQTFAAGDQSVDVDVTDLPNGVYVYRIETADQTIARKLVVLQ